MRSVRSPAEKTDPAEYAGGADPAVLHRMGLVTFALIAGHRQTRQFRDGGARCATEFALRQKVEGRDDAHGTVKHRR